MKKVIIITGASSGIGKAAALGLLKEGNIVYGAARRIDKMQEISKAGGIAIEMDITKADQIHRLVTTVIEDHGRIDVLVNNAGFGSYGSVEETLLEDARRQFEVNIFGLAALTQKVIPHMRMQQAGTIMNISSIGGKVYTPLGAWYHATKHALEGWSDCLRLELREFNIDVVIIEPGAIATEFADVMIAPMLKRSNNGPYANLASAVAQVARDSYNNSRKSSPPEVIAATIVNAVNSPSPKTRYAAGKYARLLLFIRKVVSDKVFDKLILHQMK